MTKKTTTSRPISRRRLMTADSAGAALAASTAPYGTEAQDQVRAGQLAVAQFNDAGGRMSAWVKSGPEAFSL